MQDAVLWWDQWFRVQMRNNWGAFLCGDTCRNLHSDHSQNGQTIFYKTCCHGMPMACGTAHSFQKSHWVVLLEPMLYTLRIQLQQQSTLCACMFTYVAAHAKVLAEGKDRQESPCWLSTLCTEAESPLNSELTDWPHLASQFILRILSFWLLGWVTGGASWSPRFYVCGRFSCLHSRWFICWAISPGQTMPIHNNLSGCHKISETS